MDVAEFGNGVLAEAEDTVEEDGVELDYIELGLTAGQGGESNGDGLWLGGE